MKKLMIAAAAAAMVGGAYAKDECIACGIDERGKDGTNPAFYDITLKFKTLTPKAVKCGDCEDFCMENANRTINGIVWTCVNCDDNHQLQIALWEKATKKQFTANLVYGQIAGTTQYYTGKATYEATGNYTSTTNYASEAKATIACQLDFGTDPSTVNKVDDCPVFGQTNWYYTVAVSGKEYTGVAEDGKYTSCDAARTAALEDGMAQKKAWMTEFKLKSVTCNKGKTDGAVDCTWQTEAADLDWYRYSKKADKVEASLKLDNGSGLTFWAVGFGTFDAKVKVAKSVSGNAVGTLDPTDLCTDEGKLLEFCSDFECGPDCWGYHADTFAADDATTFASGTWTLKYNKGLEKKTMTSIVPSYYDIDDADAACVK